MEYVLCHHIYQCTPSELDEQDAHTVAIHLSMFDAEAWFRARKSKKNGTPPPDPTP